MADPAQSWRLPVIAGRLSEDTGGPLQNCGSFGRIGN